eukprot:14058085-Heterocapsa_arctica.AAC.1
MALAQAQESSAVAWPLAHPQGARGAPVLKGEDLEHEGSWEAFDSEFLAASFSCGRNGEWEGLAKLLEGPDVAVAFNPSA